MGACASKFTVLSSADGAPAEPVETRDVKLAEETVKEDAATVEAPAEAPAEEEEAKRQSLGEWFKENEGAEVVAKNPAPVADAPGKDEAGKAPVNDDLDSKTCEEKKTGEKSEENKPDEKKSEETKQNLISIVEKKPDAPEMEVTHEQKATSEKEKEKEKQKETIEAKLAETTKLEMLVKIEDKPVMEAHKTEKPVDESFTDKKHATPELEHEVQKSGLDAEEKEKEELKPEVTTNIVVTEKEPETSDAKSPDELRPILDAEKEKTENPTQTKEILTATEVSTKVAVEPASDTELPKTEK